MSGTGLASTANVKRSYGLASGTVRSGSANDRAGRSFGVDLVDDLRPSIRYRTPADVRAIPNQQFDRWVLGYESFPFSEFSAAGDVQETLGAVIDAACRRVGVPLPKRKRKPLS